MHVTYSPYRDGRRLMARVAQSLPRHHHISQIESSSPYQFRARHGLFNRKFLDIILDNVMAPAAR